MTLAEILLTAGLTALPVTIGALPIVWLLTKPRRRDELVG